MLVGRRKSLAPGGRRGRTGSDDDALADGDLRRTAIPGTEGVVVHDVGLVSGIPGENGITFLRSVAESGVESTSNREDGANEAESRGSRDGDAAGLNNLAYEIDRGGRRNVDEQSNSGRKSNARISQVPSTEGEVVDHKAAAIPGEQGALVREASEQGMGTVAGTIVQRVSNEVVASHEADLGVANDVGANCTESDRSGQGGRDRQEKGFGLHVYCL